MKKSSKGQKMQNVNGANKSAQKVDNKEIIAQSMKHINQLAISEIRQKNYKQAIDYFTQSLVLEEKMGMKVQMAESFYNMAGVYYLMEEYDLALQKVQMAEILFLQENKKEAVIKTQELIREIKEKTNKNEHSKQD